MTRALNHTAVDVANTAQATLTDAVSRKREITAIRRFKPDQRDRPTPAIHKKEHNKP
jgi:hypothetical protein